ncbi:MAG TPA: heterodisulfide reductase-related iron-sulfur binding cluster [Telmatospirillum sp.]|nr:heterodisulfide reductase-related iron-sulfur binding cluster [Telmatospirillum sp.]
MPDVAPETLVVRIIELCADCGLCQEMMAGAPCQFFPRLFRLHERSADGGATSDDLKTLIDLCNACGQCPCQSVQAKIREAKDAFVERDGLPTTVRLLEDVRLMGRLCGAVPRLANLLIQNEPTAGLLKKAVGIHPDRKLPRFPKDGFDSWAERRGLCRMRETVGQKVAYFTGCTARYMFPEVAKAAVEVLEHNGISVYLPDQRCCGMPTMLEGHRAFTFELAGFNVPELLRCIEAGYDIVTSCPTCGYMLKSVLRLGAPFSKEYRARVTEMVAEAGGDLTAVGERLEREEMAFSGRANAESAWGRQPWFLAYIGGGRIRDMVCDDGYFAALDGRDRIRVASHTFELGEYLRLLRDAGTLNRDFGPLPARLAYYPPCHLKEQNIGQPWAELLALLPGTRMETVGGVYDCCGLGGVMGFKKDFHRVSLAMGRRLMAKIKASDPDKVVTDCLSCRLQFNQMLAYPVAHPVEILWESYRSGIESVKAAPGNAQPA